MRSKRPPAMSFLLRMDTARRAARVVSLLALDFVGVALAIFTALVLKEVVLGSLNATPCLRRDQALPVPFAYLLTALLFARSGLYAARSQRPGLSRIVGSLFQVAFVALIFAVVSGEHFSSFYIFYGSLAFALLYVSSLRGVLRGADGRGAAGGRVPAPRGAGGHGRAHPRRRARARRAVRITRRCEVVGYLSLRAAASERAALRWERSTNLDEVLRGRADRRGDHRRLGLSPGRGGRARRPLPPARGARADRAVDDGDPDPPRRVRAGRVGAAVRARAARVRGHRLCAEARVRPDRRDAAADPAEPAAGADRARGAPELARADPVSLDPSRHRPAAVSPA